MRAHRSNGFDGLRDVLTQTVDTRALETEFCGQHFARNASGEACAQFSEPLRRECWCATELHAFGTRTRLAFFGALVDEVAFKTGDGTEN